MKNINTKIAIWVIILINIWGWIIFTPSVLRDYCDFQELVWRMDSTQSRLIKELVDANNKTVANQNQMMKYLKDEKEKQP